MIIRAASNVTPLTSARLGLEARSLEAGNGTGFVVFAPVAGDADGANDVTGVRVDATHLKAHRTAASLLKKGMFPAVSDARKAA